MASSMTTHRYSMPRWKLWSLCILWSLWIRPAIAGEGSLVVSSALDPGNWDPVATYTVPWAAVASNLFDGLIERTPDLKLVPGLATSWKEFDQGRRIRFVLRRGVRFHNGEPLTAEAVRFTFERLLKGRAGPQHSNYTAIREVRVIDPQTVDFLLAQPDPVLLTKLAGYGAMIVPPRYIQEKGDDYFAMNPVGTGPFRFVSYEPKNNIKLASYPQYWGAVPKLATLEYRFITESSTALAELQAGRVDIVLPPVPVGAIPTIEKNAQLRILSIPSPTANALRFNTRDGISKDLRVRHAMILGVDREAIVRSILGGQAAAITSFQSPLSFGYDKKAQAIPYDPAQARALLQQAGIKPGTRVQMDIRGNDATFNEVAQAVASQLQAIGLAVSIKPYETGVLINDIIPNGKTGALFQQGWGGWTLDYDNTAYLMYHTGERWNPYDADPTLDKLLEAQRGMLNPRAREAKLQEIARYVTEQALELPLYSLNAIYAVNRRVQDFTPAPDSRIKLNRVSVK